MDYMKAVVTAADQLCFEVEVEECLVRGLWGLLETATYYIKSDKWQERTPNAGIIFVEHEETVVRIAKKK